MGTILEHILNEWGKQTDKIIADARKLRSDIETVKMANKVGADPKSYRVPIKVLPPHEPNGGGGMREVFVIYDK